MAQEGSSVPSLSPTQAAPSVNLGTMSLTKKKRIRGGYRAHATKLVGESLAELEKEQPSKIKCDQLIRSLTEKLRLLRTIDEEIFHMIDDDEIENEVIECEDVNSDIQNVVVQLEEKRNVVAVNVNESVIVAQPSPTQNAFENTKLPKLSLPKFYGDSRKWQEWWDAFEAVHNNNSLSQANKFRHLKSLLEGQAAAAISGIQITNANYNEAIDILKERFAQKQVIINSYVEVLMNLPQISSERDIKGLRKLYDNLEATIRSLKTQGINYEEYGVILIPMIMQKLPEEIKLSITKCIKKDDWGLDRVLEILRAELEAREQCKQLEIRGTNSYRQPVRYQPPHTTTSALLNNNGSRISCTFWKNAHYSAKCTVVTNPASRKQFLKREGRCFICLRKGHLSRNCESRIRCYFCKERHHASICERKGDDLNANPLQLQQAVPSERSNPVHASQQINLSAPPQASMPMSQQQRHQTPGPGSSTTTMFVEVKHPILLQTAKCYASAVSNTQKTAIARIVFDTGSQHTYISQKLRDTLQLPTVSRETLTIKPFGSDTGTPQQCDVTQLCLRTPYNDLSTYLTAYVVPTVCAPVNNQPIQFAASRYPHLSGLMLADFAQDDTPQLQIDILVGLDYYWFFFNGVTIRGELGGPIALESKLGWILSGPVELPSPATTVAINVTDSHVLRVDHNEETALDKQLSRFWDLESLGIMQKDEESIYENFVDNINFKNGHYEVRLPWKQNHPVLPDNYSLSKKRLQGLLSRLKNDPELLQEYDTIIKDQERAGIIEKVNPCDDSPVGKTHYLAHHAVIRRDKSTTKVRVVYDASASTASGTSLNNCVYPGPCLLKTVAEILVRFRMYPIAITGDIEKAFLMISVHKEDRDSLRFLWYEDVRSEVAKTVTYRFCRVVFGVSCSPYLLNATLKHHIQKYSEVNPEISNKLIHSLYADDVTSGAHNVQEALELYEKAKDIMKEGGFNLRKFHSNSKEVMAKVLFDEASVYKKLNNENENDASTAEEIKVLGLNWDLERDTFNFDLSVIAKDSKNLPATKRNVLRTIAKIFDPLGLITPITTQFKVFLQELFTLKLGWDDSIPEHLEREWRSVLNSLEQADEIPVPRYYFGEQTVKPDEIQLYGFCDSSGKAFAAAVYAKMTINGESSVRLVTAKTRVAPLSKPTIPRLELLACVILARLITSVKDMFLPVTKVNIVQCWTDSITALYWIKGCSKEWKVFIENRVQEIRKLTNPSLWSHCPGSENPADIPTRPISISQFANMGAWWSGPKWLSFDCSAWPAQPNQNEVPKDCLDEQKSKNSQENITLLTQNSQNASTELISLERFSDYKKLLRVLSYVLRFVHNCRRKEAQKRDELSAEELKLAEMILIRNTQRSFKQSRLDDLKKQLGTFKDKDGIIRCRGRLSKSSLDYEAKNPILLPRESYFVKLLILHCHEEVMHNGTKETLAELRSRFWVVKGRQAVKKIIRPCQICRRIQGQSYGEPISGQLPEFRSHEGHAFQSVGIDFAGPLYVKTSSNPARKVYIALFTCATSRALHLEIVPDLTVESFLLCLHRFVGRRGIPSLIVTDNAKTFKAASKILVKLFKSQKISAYLASQEITWRYNLAKAPFWGGFFERLIKSVKSSMKKCIGKAKLSYDELNTVAIKIEAVMNARPLTYLYSDSIEEPLTPSHLVIGRRILDLPLSDELPNEDEDFNVTSNATRSRQKYLSRILTHYWKRWKREYLVDLREYQRIITKNESTPQIKEGDVVTVEDENQRNRRFWKLGRIHRVIKDNEGVARGAKIRLSNGNLIERPIQKLFPLELSEINIESNSDTTEKESTNESLHRRPTRDAATIARVKIIDQLQD